MKATGRMIKLVERENSYMLMAIFMKGNGLMTKLMAMVNICITTELSILVIGRMISNTVKAKKLGLVASLFIFELSVDGAHYDG